MIFVDRNKVDKPEYFFSPGLQKANDELKRFYQISSRKRAQLRFTYSDYSTPYEVLEVLYKLFNGKCAYCESRIEKRKSTSNSVLNLFRPANNAKGLRKEETSVDHYWWLTHEWNNIYFSCRDCDRFKASWFPVEGKRAKPLTSYENIIKKEINLILDPCIDNIPQHFSFNFKTGEIYSKSKKGKITIEILKLNRKRLISGRLFAIKEEAKNWDNYIKNIENNPKVLKNEIVSHWMNLFTDSVKSKFLGIRRSFLVQKLNNNPDINKTVFKFFTESNKRIYYTYGVNPLSIDIDTDIKPIYPHILRYMKNIELSDSDRTIYIDNKDAPFDRKIIISKEDFENQDDPINFIDLPLFRNVYIEKIELKNFKCFRKLIINLKSNKDLLTEPWLVFLGENGFGKSSLLKAIAIALMGQKNINKLGLKASKLLRYRSRLGYIKLYGNQDKEIYEVKFSNKNEKIISNIQTPPSYIIGYGSVRLLPLGNLKPEEDVDSVKVKNLFNHSISLFDTKSWLLESSKKMFDQVARSLKDLLLLDNKDIIKRDLKKKSIFIDYDKSNNIIDINELSDGYKSIFAITTDIIQTLSKDNISFETAEGIILIDEIGTHLHPRWKMEVVNRLRRTFPKLQFIATTHEPLCLRGLYKDEVVVLKNDTNGKIIPITDLPNPNEFRVDQLLNSEYFGLNSTLDFETEALFKEYYNLLAKVKRTNDEQNRVSELNQILPNRKHIGDDIRDELVYFVIDELLAKQIKEKGYKIVDKDLKNEALKRVKDIWEFMSKNEN